MKKTAIDRAIDTMVNDSIRVNKSSDFDMLNNISETWDDLQNIKNTIAMGVLEFVTQIEQITGTTVIMANLGANENRFRRLENVFYTDLNGFTLKVQELRQEHDHRSGPITSMDDLVIYNRLALEYASLNQQLTTLIAPTITEMILLVNEIVPTAMAAAELAKAEAQSVNVITDVEVKNV